MNCVNSKEKREKRLTKKVALRQRRCAPAPSIEAHPPGRKWLRWVLLVAIFGLLITARLVPLAARLANDRPEVVGQRTSIIPRHWELSGQGRWLGVGGDGQGVPWSRSGITSTAGVTDTVPHAHWPGWFGLLIWHAGAHDAMNRGFCFYNRSDPPRGQDGTLPGEPTPTHRAPKIEEQPTLLDTPLLDVSPKRPVLLLEAGATDPVVATVQIENEGVGSMTWSATVLPESSLVPALSALHGRPGQALDLQIDPSNLDVGVYTISLMIRGLPTTTRHAPQQVEIEVHVVRELDRLYLPALMRQFRTSVAPQATPTPIAPTEADPYGPSKIGFHAINSGGALETVRQVRSRGAHVAVVKGLSFGYLCEVKQASPETVTVGRWSDAAWEAVTAVGDPAAQAVQHMDVHMEHWAGYENCVDYWEILNEVDPPTIDGHVWLAEFFKSVMDIAQSEGYRLALFSYSVGVPEIYEWEAMAETGVFAQAQAGGHILALHEYGGPLMTSDWGETLPTYPGQDPDDPSLPRYADRGALAGRYRHLYRDILIPRGEAVPLVISEANVGTYDPEARAEVFLEQIAWYDDRLREDDYVIGMAIFTLGGVGIGWDHFDYDQFLPELADRIVALQPHQPVHNWR